ncbi:MAG: DNA polymerase III subunit delta' [Lachnospiraceae bacterium]|jgi:DNA polymerase-3 subunit delta'|nr:DNA polymerase III subunit delta' [Lachnospiraceae bacterium]
MSGFSDILGNEMIKEYFARTFVNGQISHAYILTGEAGMGRKTLARAFAMTLLCEKDGPMAQKPCGKCHSCVQFLSDNHPDVIYVTHEKTGIGVDDIRVQVNGTVQIRPYSSAYKVYIIDEAQKMTAEAQNALLKTLEEPPSYAVILLLTTRADSFLPTILSRCITLKLKPLYDDVIRTYLTDKLGVPRSEAEICTAFARGNLGRAMEISSSEEFGRLRRSVTSLLRSTQSLTVSQMLEVFKQWKDDDVDMDECLDFMQMWYRDVLMFKATQDMAGFIFKDEYKYIREISERSSFHGIEEILNAIEKARSRLAANVNFTLVMELMLLTIKEN